jgi:hypothetical protein
MTRSFTLNLLAALARALAAGCCSEAFRAMLLYFVPTISSLASLGVGVTLGVIFVEVALALCHRRTN